MKRRKSQSPLQKIFAKIKRMILICSGILFLGFLYAAYHEFHATFSSRPGRVFTWSAKTALSPLIQSIPWWIWAIGLLLAGWLWTKHKLAMSIIYGVAIGIFLAIS